MNRMKLVNGFLIVSMLALLPNCDWLKNEEGEVKKSVPETPSKATSSSAPSAPSTKSSGPTSEVLLTLYDEKTPKVTMADFQNYKKELLEAQPNYASIIEFMPGANKQIFDSLVNETILEEFIKKNKIDQTQTI